MKWFSNFIMVIFLLNVHSIVFSQDAEPLVVDPNLPQDTTIVKANTKTPQVTATDTTEEKRPNPSLNFSYPSKSYTISIGANFDFLDGLKTNDVYSELSLLITKIFGEKSKWGLYAGIYQSKTVSDADTVNESIDLFLNAVNEDSVEITHQELRIITNKEKSNLGLFFSPTYQKSENFYWNLHFEIQKKDFLFITNETVLDSDTSIIEMPNSMLIEHNSHPDYRSVDYYPYFGAGFMLLHGDETADIMLRVILGYSNSTKLVDYDEKTEHHFFHLTQFKITEKNNGIKFGGEVRGIGNYAPEITIYLAKEFSLNILNTLFSK